MYYIENQYGMLLEFSCDNMRYPRINRASICKQKKREQKVLSMICAPLGIRTLDPLIKSQLLYQLS